VLMLCRCCVVADPVPNLYKTSTGDLHKTASCLTDLLQRPATIAWLDCFTTRKSPGSAKHHQDRLDLRLGQQKPTLEPDGQSARSSASSWPTLLS
jgi:hypothetical protein